MKKLLPLLLLLAAPLHAATVSVADASGLTSSNNFNQQVIQMNSGALLTTSAVVKVGYFKGFDGTNPYLADLRNVDRTVVMAAVTNYFVPLGQVGGDSDLGSSPPTGTGARTDPRIASRTIDGQPGQLGRLIGSVTGVKASANPANSYDAANITGVPTGTRLFMIVSDAPLSSATEFGILSAENWLFADNPTGTASVSLNTVDVNLDAEIFRGRKGSIHLGSIVTIPEPTSFTLAGLAVIGLISKRRRA